MGIMQSLRKRDRRSAGAAPVAPSAARAPDLMVLLPDAAGIATYQLHSFDSARAAELFVDSTLRGQVNEGTVFFWALTWQPSPDAEPLVLIRDGARPLVYLFSFLDLDACHEFVRYEMQRGLDLAQVMIYWAVPARVGFDEWGAAFVAPSAAPQRPAGDASGDEPVATVVPFSPNEAAPVTGQRYLTEADIAEAIREMDEFVKRPPARPIPEPAPIIDFPAASEQIQRARQARQAADAWSNFALALDEALDVHVAIQVSNKLAWNRIMRALTEAARLQKRRDAAANAWGNASRALAAAAAIASGGDGTMRRVWLTAATALAEAAELAAARITFRKPWQNAAWAIEEAVYAYRLETRARVTHAWGSAGLAIAEAVQAREASEKAARLGWANTARALGEAESAFERRARARAAWHEISNAINRALEARFRRDAAIAAWTNIGGAMNAAVAAQEAYQRRRRIIVGWRNATTALMEAIVAEAKLRILHAGLDKRLIAAVDRKVKGKTKISLGKPAGRSTVIIERPEPVTTESEAESPSDEHAGSAPPEHTAHTIAKRWERREEPFDGFRSPPGRFHHQELPRNLRF